MDAKEEIRERLNIEDVVGEYVELKRAGRNFKALSPFTSEKTPSFMVSPDKRIWHDFSSGKGGDVFSFIMEVEGLEFKEALKLLARKAGVELKLYSTAKSQKLAKQKQRLLEANQVAASYFQFALTKNRAAHDYAFKARQLDEEIIKNFQIGYAPNLRDQLVKILAKKGFTKAEIAQAGLTNQYGGDLFRARLMIPLMDASGQIVGFTGRGLSAEAVPKYLNTPATLIYDKSRQVFGLSQAKEMIRKTNQVVMVEGNMDVVSSHQADVRNVVATSGTAMTLEHLKIISRYTTDVRLAFDADSAGVRATERAVELAQQLGLDIKIISLPVGFKDPDELVKHDVKLWQQAISSAQPAIDWLMLTFQTEFDIATAQGKRDYSRRILAVINKLVDAVEKNDYYQRLAEIIDLPVEVILDQSAEQQAAKSRATSRRKKPIIDQAKTAVDHLAYENDLLALGLLSAKVRGLFDQQLIERISGDQRQEMMQFLINTPKLEKTSFDGLSDLAIYAKILAEVAVERHYLDMSQVKQMTEAKRLIKQVNQNYQHRTKIELTQALHQAEIAGDEAEAARLTELLQQQIKLANQSK